MWVYESILVQVTVLLSPMTTVTVAGLKAKFCILTATGGSFPGQADDGGAMVDTRVATKSMAVNEASSGYFGLGLAIPKG